MKRVLFLIFWVVTGAGFAAAQELTTYQDAKGRYAFDYPAAWGAVSPGTNDGFKNRVAALRFSQFTPSALGGELVLTRGRVGFDLQLLGGLYDAIALEAVPDATRARLAGVLPDQILHNFCALLEKPHHLKSGHRILKYLPEAELQALQTLDTMRNENPTVHRCRIHHHTVTFHKEVTFRAGTVQTRQHVYGAVRFLKNRYSSFQMVRAHNTPPDEATLTAMANTVTSWRFGR